jgi:hypothetical protein
MGLLKAYTERSPNRSVAATSRRRRRFLAVLLTALVSGCASSIPMQPTLRVTPESNGPYAYVSFGVAGLVYLYSLKSLNLSTAVDTGKTHTASGLTYMDSRGRLLIGMFERNDIDVYLPPYSRATEHIRLADKLQPFLLLEGDHGRLFVGAISFVNGAPFYWLITSQSPFSKSTDWTQIQTPDTMQAAKLTTDATGNLFVGFCCGANESSLLERFEPPYRLAPTLRLPLRGLPYALKIDAHQNLIAVTNDGGRGRIYAVPPPYTANPTQVLSTTRALSSAAISASGRVFMTDIKSILVYEPPYRRSGTQLIPLPNEQRLSPERVAADERETLYVLSRTDSFSSQQLFEIVSYPPPYRRLGADSGAQPFPPNATPGFLGLQP